MTKQIRRWLPERAIVLVADQSYAVLSFLNACSTLARPVTVVTRLRLDAALHEPAPPRKAGQNGRPRKRGQRLPSLKTVLDDPKRVWTRTRVNGWYSQGKREVEMVSDTCVWTNGGQPVVPIKWVLLRDPEGKFRSQALLCTDLSATPEQIIRWFVLRWQLETTFQQVRTHLGVETQRQWNERAIDRTTPALLGMLSIVTLLAHHLNEQGRLSVRQAAWYIKELPTFSDAIASVRRQLWHDMAFCISSQQADVQKLKDIMLRQFADTLCYSA